MLSHKQKGKIDYRGVDIYDPKRGWRLIKNLRNRLCKGARVNSNSDGVRGEREFSSDKEAVLFFGDSFCFGEGVGDHESIPAFFERHFDGIQSINLGVHGYGIDQQYLYLKEVADRYKSRIVCFIINFDDFNRNFVKFRDYAKPKFTLRKGAIVLTNYPVPEPKYYLRTSKRMFYFPILLDFARQLLIYYGVIERKKREKICLYILEQIQRIVDKLNSKLIFLYVPNYLNKLLKNYVDDFFIDFFRKRNIAYLNIGDAFTKCQLKNMPDSSTSHFYARSNKLVADKLAELVRKQRLL